MGDKRNHPVTVSLCHRVIKKFHIPMLLSLVRQGLSPHLTIRLIMGLYGADAGEISVLGANLKTQEAQVKDQIGFVLPREIFAGGCTLESDGWQAPPHVPRPK